MIRLPRSKRARVILALIIANEIRGLIVVATIAPALWKGIGL